MAFGKKSIKPDPADERKAALDARRADTRRHFHVVSLSVSPYGNNVYVLGMPTIDFRWFASFDTFAEADAYARASGENVAVVMAHDHYKRISVPESRP